MFAGFKAARRAYDEHEQVLQLDPARKDAELVVGTYRYVVSTLSLPLRMMAYVAGFGGGRERGIQALTEASVAGESPNRRRTRVCGTVCGSGCGTGRGRVGGRACRPAGGSGCMSGLMASRTARGGRWPARSR